MDIYRVIDTPVTLGAGTIVSLDADQLAIRAHRVIDSGKTDSDGRHIVTLNDLLAFKPGELIGVAAEPKGLENRLEKIGAAKGGEDMVAKRNERMDAIVGAIGKLNRRNRQHFTGDGIPAVSAIEEVLGFDISAAERDAAWQRVQAAAQRKPQ